jgi:hypothetical protein
VSRQPVAGSTRTRRLRMWLVLALSVVAAGAAVATWLAWPRPAAVPQARQYLNLSACLLTGPSGIAADTPGAPAWAAMRAASLDSHVMVSYLSDSGPGDAAVMLSTLMQRQCGVIIAAGIAPAQVIRAAGTNPHQHFLLVAARAGGGGTEAAPANAAIVSAADAPGRIRQAIHALASAG